METIKINELLKGYKVDRSGTQNAANMIVVPLISETEYTPIADFTSINLNRDVAYGELEFKNISDDIGILLQGYTLITSQHAQDRTVPYAHLIKGKSTTRVAANCVQAHQCGLIDVSRLKTSDIKILPPSLRAMAMIKGHPNSTNSQDFGALWGNLATWADKIDLKEGGLVAFYTKFKEQLDQFVASFESVNNQLGAITILNNEIVAIDIVPKYNTWLQIFRPLIRDSYGAEAIRLIQNGQIKSLVSILDDKKVDDINDLEKEFNKNTETFFDSISDIVKQNTELEVEYKALQEIGDLNLVKFESQGMIGCGVFHGDHVVYLSLVSKDIMRKKEKVSDFKSTGVYSNNRFTI